MSKSNHVSRVVGERLREWREAAGLRQEEVAWAARDHGLDWKAATVGVIETGRRNVSLTELLVLPLIVGSLPRLSTNKFATPEYFLGPFATLLKPANESEAEDQRHVAIAASQAASDDPADRIRVEAHGEAERHAARVLNERSFDVARMARQLWNRSLTEERDARVRQRAAEGATARTLQAHRGHVTRELVAQLQAKRDEYRAEWDRHAMRLWGQTWDERIAARVADGLDRDEAWREAAREINPEIARRS